MSTRRNMALVVAAQNVVETFGRLKGDHWLQTIEPHNRFAVLLAKSIEQGDLRGRGNLEALEILNEAYHDLMVHWWEQCETERAAQEALDAQKAAADPAALSLDEVLADRAPLYRKGDKVTLGYEGWASGPEDGVVSSAEWRAEGLDNWVYGVVTPQGSYVVREGDTAWDIDFTKK